MRDLRVNITGNQTGFQQVLNSVRHEGKKFSEEWSVAGLGKRMVLGAGSLLGFEAVRASFDSFIERASSLRQLSEQLEMSAEATQKWEKAADRLGLSFGTVQNVLMAIGSKRLEAIFDPKVADQFQRLGISRQAVLNTQGMDNSEFAKLVYQGAKSEDGRAVFAELFGNRALKTLGIGKLVDGMTPTFSKEALEGAHEAELAEKKVGNFVSRWWGNLITDVVKSVESFRTGDIWAPGVKESLKRPFAWQKQLQAQPGAPASAETAPGPARSEAGPIQDPMASILADKALQRQMQVDAAERGQHERERQMMTIAERRVSIMQDMLRVRRQIEELESAKAPENLRSAEEIADWEAKRKEQLSGLRGQLAGYKTELRERSPFSSAGADSLSRLGLFSSAAALTFPPGGAQGNRDLLRKIEHHTFRMANKEDPHAP